MMTVASTRDRVWPAVLALTFVFSLAASWQRWGNPLIDDGREMNQPLRLMQGERLYADVRHIYGPLSPWLHAALYRRFGPSLTVLYADGIVSAIVILALLYWLARRIMDPAGAAAATLSVMALCVFRPSGVYILPYSYNALHGTLFGLAALALFVRALTAASRSRQTRGFLLAGAAGGVTLLAKTEIGVATMVAGVAAAWLAARSPAGVSWRRAATLAASCLGASLGPAIVVYAAIAARVGWSTLVSDSWLLMYNIPSELRYYNSRVSGFDRPLENVGRMLVAAAKLGIIATLVGALAHLRGGTPASRSRAWRLLAIAAATFAVLSITSGLDWDKGPYLAMPFLLVALLARVRSPILILYGVYALANLARMLLHVRSGGSYASYLLPMSVVIFTYLWLEPFPRLFASPPAQRAARAMLLTLILGQVIVSAGVTAHRYRTRHTDAIATARGTMLTTPDVAQAWNEALAYIGAHTAPGDAVAVLPEGTSLDFLSGRRNPLREEIATPGFLDAAGEARAIRQLQDARTALVLIPNRITAEFGPALFGRDYNQRLMAWIAAHYRPCALFGPVKDPSLQIGDAPFFVRAYCLATGRR